MKRTPLAPRSQRRTEIMNEDRVPRIRRIIESGVGCLIGPLLHDAGVDVQCQRTVQGLHERRKRSAGGSLTNPRNLIPACNVCNGWIEDHPQLARDLYGDTLCVREGDPEWPHLGHKPPSM